MKLVLYGMSHALWPLLDAVDRSDRMQIVAWYAETPFSAKLAQRLPTAEYIEDRATYSFVDAVVAVAEGVPGSESLMRELARDGVPMLVEQAACSGIFAVELDMIQRDTLAPLIPIDIASLHPAIDYLAELARNEQTTMGTLEQIVMERQADDRSDELVRGVLARDALLLRRLAGNLHRVGGMHCESTSTSLANLSIHLTGDSETMVRWSIGPVDEKPGATISLVGTRGRVTLQMPEKGEWSWPAGSGSAAMPSFAEHDAVGSLMEHIETGLKRQEICPSWEEAFRALDLTDTAVESVRRGKTLPISNQRLSEEDTFKSMMAAGGCLILLVLPLLLLLVSLVDGLQIPYTKATTLLALKSQRAVLLPPDLASVDSVLLTDSQRPILAMSSQQLAGRYGRSTSGVPEAYAVTGDEMILAPIPEQAVELEIRYKGNFSIWRGWPFMLVLPIVFFLAMQLFKLVFPRRVPVEAGSVPETP